MNWLGTAGKPEDAEETLRRETEKAQGDQSTPVEVTITVPGHTVTVKAAEPMAAVTAEALHLLGAAATLVHRDEKTGQHL